MSETNEPQVDETAENGEENEAPEQPEEVVEAVENVEEFPAQDAKMPPSYDELEGQVGELKDQLMRALAETENIRKRSRREKEDASKYAIANFAKELLDVADNLRRAIDSVPEDARETDEAVKNLMVGVEMTEKSLLGVFDKVGIQQVNALGQAFDHNYHQAMFEVEDPSQPNGTVVQQMQAGYVIHNRLLRPAMVGVSKGGPKRETETPAATEEAPSQGGAYEQSGDAPAGSKIDTEL